MTEQSPREKRPTLYTPEGFWAAVDKNGPIPGCRPDLGRCWLWTGAPEHGCRLHLGARPADRKARLDCRGDPMKKCPRCDSPQPHLHPAMQWEGEVEPCRHQYHATITPSNTAKRVEAWRQWCVVYVPVEVSS